MVAAVLIAQVASDCYGTVSLPHLYAFVAGTDEEFGPMFLSGTRNSRKLVSVQTYLRGPLVDD